MTGILAAAAVLLAQGPMCGGQHDLRPDDTALLLTGCFIPSGRGDGSGAQIRIDPLLSPSGYRATPIPPRRQPWDPAPTWP